MSYSKRMLGKNVLEASRERISWAFDNFSRIYVAFSGGKDSTVMLHLVMDEAIKREKKVGVLFVDLEGQYKLTIDHIQECYDMYSGWVDPYWVALPIHLRNAVSEFQSHWICWDPDCRENWIREPPGISITDQNYFPFFHKGMEFEEFIVDFGKWYSDEETTACFVGIRTRESLNRWRTISSMKKSKMEDKCYTTKCTAYMYNIFPIYDWTDEDIWVYHGKNPGKPYNKLYDIMHQAGLSLYQMRICQPYGDDQKRGLWLFHIIEPKTWAKIVARVNGANQGSLYAREMGNISGMGRITLPQNHTWKSFTLMLLDSMPEKTQNHYKNKIAVFLKWYADRDYPDGIPDDGELTKGKPSWKRICKTVLRNDYWCKGLSFSQNRSTAYENYLKIMKKRREEWKLI